MNILTCKMGSKTKFSATEAASVFEYMAMAGWRTEAMLETVERVVVFDDRIEVEMKEAMSA